MKGAALMDDLTTLLQHQSMVPWTIGIGIIALLASKAPGIAGGFGKAWTAWLEEQRRAAELRDDADIVDLKRQVENLMTETGRLRTAVGELRAEMRRRDTALHDHYPWDVQAYQLIIAHVGKDAIEPPPSLWPPEPDTSLPTDTP